MFDSYEPAPPLGCARCGQELRGWQGKRGPCGLFIWREGYAAPVGQHGDPEHRLSPDELSRLRLARDVEVYTTCEACGQPAQATGFVADAVWRGTVRGRHAGEAAVPATHIEGRWRQCSGCADAWEEPERALAECPYCRAVTRLDAPAPD